MGWGEVRGREREKSHERRKRHADGVLDQVNDELLQFAKGSFCFWVVLAERNTVVFVAPQLVSGRASGFSV